MVLLKFNVQIKVCYSVDIYLLEEAVHYPIEFLNSLNIPEIQPHKLILKEGSRMILLQNL